MIHCPKCGAANRRGSRFCNECGESLPIRTALRCPMCGTMNSVGNVYCDRCHARLIPLTTSPPDGDDQEPAPVPAPVKGLSLPTIPLDEKGEPDTEGAVGREDAEADWLTQLRGVAASDDVGPEISETRPEVGMEAEEETGDWLSQLRPTTEAAASVDAQDIVPVEMDDWLTQLRTTPERDEEVEESFEQFDLPDWLQDKEPVAEESEPTPSEPLAPPPVEAAAVPDWLVEVAPSEEREAPPSPVEAAEVPDWLMEMAPPEEVEPAPPPVEAAEVPDWLVEMAPPEEVQPPPPPVEAAAVPDWLMEMAPPEEAELPPVSPLTTDVTTPVEAETPAWLRDVAVEEEDVSRAEPVTPPLIESPRDAKVETTLDWLSDLETEAPSRPFPPAVPAFEGMPPPPSLDVDAAEVAGLARAEIPDWLEAMRPRPEAAPAAVEQDLVETSGLLQGLSGVIPPVLPIQVPAARERYVSAEGREASLTRAQLLQSLLTQQVEASKPEVSQRKASAGERVQRWVVALVLFVVVVGTLMAPLVVPGGLTLTQPVMSSVLIRAYNAVQGVDVTSTALVVFEYGAAEAGELDPVAEPILLHLLDRGVHLEVVSTRPEGMIVAEGLLAEIAASGGYTETQYTLHAYRSGNATGAAQLLRDVGVSPGLVLVLTAQPGPLRWWVEQIHALGGETPPIVTGISAALEAAASPYLDTRAGQLAGSVSGLSGAAAYESIRRVPGKATGRLDALAAGQVAIVGLMILGAILYAPSGLFRRKK